MVTINYDKTHFTLTVSGHAGAAEHGKDILCSACSILTYTLAQIVLEHSECMRQPPRVELNEGTAVIQCAPKENCIEKINCIFDTIMTGFDLLAVSYPKNIKIFCGAG